MKALGLYTHTHTDVLENKKKTSKERKERKLELRNGKICLARRKRVKSNRVGIKREKEKENLEETIKNNSLNSNIEVAINDLKNDSHKLNIKENSLNKNSIKLARNSGITLIALIVTIIVLLTLAGISISMLTGENSIVRNAQKAKVETEKAEVEEKVRLAVMGAYDSNGNFDEEKLKAELNSLGVAYSEAGSEFLIEIPNGKQIMVSKTTGDIREGVHKIAYNYNGGEDIGQVPSDDTEYKEGENITIKFSPVGEREGFEFLGWSTSAGATEAEFTSTGTNTITMERRSITLYAVWKGIPHTISYDANTGTGAVPTTGAGIRGENVAVNFTPIPTKAGYTFVGWSEDKTSNSAEYTLDGIKTIKMPAKDVTLYAIWMANSNTAYKVEHYQMDTSGNYPETATGSNTYTNGTTDASLTVANLKENYAGFTYRYGQVNGTTVETTTVAGDGSRVIKLYYERLTYTVTYNANSGTVTPASANGYHGATITLPTPSRTGYTFNGWFTQASGGTPLNTTMAIPINGTTIYAQWTINKYKITYVGNGGSTPSAIEANYGATISMSATSTRTGGYKFDGWYSQATGGAKVNHTTMPVNGATVYAHWTYLLNTVGAEVTVGGEQFYVIEANPESSNTNVKLLSKFNLNQAGTAQQNANYTTTACKFSNSNYWNANSKDLNYDHTDSIAYKRAKAYGTAKGGTGRLLTYDEANSLKTSMADELYGKNIGASDNYLYYWLGTSDSSNGAGGYVWRVYGGSSYLDGYPYSIDGMDGVRAVLSVSKSKIS